MTYGELKKKVTEIVSEHDSFDYLGLRAENRLYKVGEELENSRYLNELVCDREFPAYGTAGYEELEELFGTSSSSLDKIDEALWYFGRKRDGSNDNDQVKAIGDHMYIIEGGFSPDNNDHVLDHNEIILKYATVVTVLF